MKNRGLSKRSQMELSFGMIFSIILIIVFIFFAFYGIKKFLGMQELTQIKAFVNDFQNDVERMQKSFDGTQEKSYVVPKKIERICFVNKTQDLRLLGVRYSDVVNIKGVNIEKMLVNQEEYCIDNTDGKIKLILEIKYGENLVTIKKSG